MGSSYLQDFVASLSTVDRKFNVRFEGSELEILRQVDESVHDVGAKAWVDVLGTEFANATAESRQSREIAHHHQIYVELGKKNILSDLEFFCFFCNVIWFKMSVFHTGF